MALILAMAQALYGTPMGFGYFGSLVKAAGGGEGLATRAGSIWHENVSLRGLVSKSFGYLEKPGTNPFHDGSYTEGYHVVIPSARLPYARALETAVQGSVRCGSREQGVVGVTRTRRAPIGLGAHRHHDAGAGAADFEDYMILSLVAFSFVLAGCLFEGDGFSGGTF